MGNNNPNGSAVFWFEGRVASYIDNGVSSSMPNWAGTTKYWYQGTPTGYLQGGIGSVGDSPQNLYLAAIYPVVVAVKGRGYALII